jgi:hypothetical protein
MHERERRVRWQEVYVVVCALAFAAVGCGLLKEPQPLPAPTPAGPNLFANPGFELYAPGWGLMQGTDPSNFQVSTATPHNGKGYAARLRLTSEAGAEGPAVAGFVQRLTSGEFPEFLSGFYRADVWQPGDTLQYIEFAVTVTGGDFGDGLSTHVARFLIAGAEREPAGDPTIRFTFLSRAAPPIGRWTYFAYPLRESFAFKFGKALTRWAKLEIQFAVRYDDKTADQPATSADVSFDDLFVGGQSANPNRPTDP